MVGVVNATHLWWAANGPFLLVVWGAFFVRWVLLRRWGRKNGTMAQAAARFAEEARWSGTYSAVFVTVTGLIWMLADGAPLEAALIVVAAGFGPALLAQRIMRAYTRFWARVYFGVHPAEPSSGLWEPLWPYPLRRMPRL